MTLNTYDSKYLWHLVNTYDIYQISVLGIVKEIMYANESQKVYKRHSIEFKVEAGLGQFFWAPFWLAQ